MGYEATVEEQPEYDLIPEDTICKAKLLEINPKDISWTKDGEKKSATLLIWKWEVVEGEHQGRWVFGSCDSRLTNGSNNKFRNWSESLLNREIGVGMSLDTDELVGLSAEISIKHRPDKKDPEKKYVEVDEVIPLVGGFGLDEPPF